MEASGGTPRDVVLNDVIGGCQAVIGIYSSRYGWTGARSGLSPTEEEYDRARELNKPVYAFIFNEMVVDMVSGAVELPSGNKPWINPIKQAVESALLITYRLLGS